jgi:drug/metabolite transporter (DMT)-like permease
MAVPVLAILIDYIIVDVVFSLFDFIALIFIVTGIFVAAKKPFNNIN